MRRPLNALLLSTVLIVAADAQQASLQKQLLPGATRCLDNSPAGYYFAAATDGGRGATVWVINLQGGGSCRAEADCLQRSKGKLGSSKNWPPTDAGSHSPFLLPDPAANPDFHDANRVHVAYCSGDHHSGNQSKADASTWNLWFTGKANLLAIVDDLKARHGMGKATHVLLTGESAGGTGTFYNADSVAEWMGPAVTVKAAPVSGWFFPAETGDLAGTGTARKIAWNPPSTFASFVAGRVGGWENATAAQGFVERQTLFNLEYPGGCEEAHPRDSFVCGTMDTLYPFIKAPLFVIENQFDLHVISHSEGMPIPAAGSTLNTTQKAYLRYYGAATKLSVAQVPASAKADGLFLASCLDHTGDFGSGTNTTVRGTTFVPLVGDWLFGRNKLPHIVQDDCGDLPCNPTCGSRRGGGGGGDASQCAAALVSLCASPGTKTLPPRELCDACAEQHSAQLLGAGCTTSLVGAICAGP